MSTACHTTSYVDITYTKAEGVATVTLNRPEVLNALRGQTYGEIADAFRDAVEDDSVGVVVITGAGDRAFSSGGDVRDQKQRTPEAGRKHMQRAMELYQHMRNGGKITVAAVNGYALGGGHELQLLCDVTIASDNAVFGQIGANVGSSPVWGATQLLPSIVGEKKAREMIFWCRRYDAQEALSMGLVNKVVPAAELMAEVDRWCQEVLNNSPQALRIAKTSLNASTDLVYSSYSAGMEMLSLTYGTTEQLEGVNAFLEKRPRDYRKFRTSDAEAA